MTIEEEERAYDEGWVAAMTYSARMSILYPDEWQAYAQKRYNATISRKV